MLPLYCLQVSQIVSSVTDPFRWLGMYFTLIVMINEKSAYLLGVPIFDFRKAGQRTILENCSACDLARANKQLLILYCEQGPNEINKQIGPTLELCIFQ